jgi:hypothetical protein
MSIILIIVVLVGYALFYLPVYLPFLLSFLFRAPKHRALRIALRITPIIAMVVLAFRTRPARPEFGDDVAGSFRGADYYQTHEFWPDVAWTWGTGLSCLALAFCFGFLIDRQRRHHETAIESD